MTTDRAPTFLHLLRETQVLEAAQLDELSRTPDAETTEAPVLGQCLVEMGWLTPYQAERLLQGKTTEVKLGPFVLLDKLGDSGAGVTYKAKRPGKPGVVALKVIPKRRLTTTEANTRFLQDVRTAAQLQHENIAPAITLAQAGDQYLLARTYVEGPDLERLVRESGPLPWFRACRVIRQAALALQHAHEQGLVHRRLRASNLLLDRRDGADLIIKVTDFGLAQLFLSAARPEEKPANPREDMMGLGKTMHYLLMGGTTLKDAIDLDRELGTPPGVSAVLGRLLADRGANAFNSAAEAAKALEPLCEEPPPKPPTWPDLPFSAAKGLPELPPAEVPVAEAALPMAVPLDVAATPVEEPPPPVVVTPEPVPLEGIAVPVDAVAVEPVSAELPMAEVPVAAAGVPAAEVPAMMEPPPEMELPLASAIAVVGEPAPVDVPPPSVITPSSEEPADVPVASAVAIVSEPVPVDMPPPITAGEPVADLPVASAIAAVSEPAVEVPPPAELPPASAVAFVTEPAVPEPPISAIVSEPVPEVPLADAIAPVMETAPDVAPAPPPEPFAPAVELPLPELVPAQPPAPPEPEAAAPPLAPPVEATAPPLVPPAEAPPVGDFTSSLAPPPLAPADPFAADAPTELEAPAGFDTTRPPVKKPPKRLINWSKLGKKDIMLLLLGGVLWAITMVLIYFVYVQMTRETKSTRPGPPPRRTHATKAE